MTLDEWRLVGDNGKGKAYAPNASGKTAQTVNAGVDARYKALVETAVGEGKAVPGFVRNQSMFTGKVSGATAWPKLNTDLHSVPNGTVFDMAGNKLVKTTSNMRKAGNPILTTADGKFQIIQQGDTIKVNRLADSRTGYVNIGEAGSLPQAGKIAGDAAEAMGNRPCETVLAQDAYRVLSRIEAYNTGLLFEA